MRDDFPSTTKDLLAKRVGFVCSNPACRKPTSGPRQGGSKAVNVGVAAHITVAAPGGPRYDPDLSSEARGSIENGIWLCQNCAKLVDNDPDRYSARLLLEWKEVSERLALHALESSTVGSVSKLGRFFRLEEMMPDLLNEMRADLNDNPLAREFVLLKRSWKYWAKGNELAYFFDDHEDLRNKMRVLENSGAIIDIQHNNVERFVFAEEFVDYLIE